MSQPELTRVEPRREGSPWTGLWAVVGKDMADHLSSARMVIMGILILVTAILPVYQALQNIQQNTSSDTFVFLRLFTTSQDPVPSFAGFLSFLVPLVAIILTFDAINGEFSQRTLSRVLAQPIYRDALLMGKFLAGLFTLATVLAAIWLLVIGLGILKLGVPPSGEEVARALMFLVVTIFYGGTWLALAMVFSTVFRQPATAALASIAAWLIVLIFWSILANLVVNAVVPVQTGSLQEAISRYQLGQALMQPSPNTLFVEATIGLLNPAVRSFGIAGQFLPAGAVIGAPLPLGQSIGLIWPQLAGLIAITTLTFALSYVLFQRQEIRA